jgi:hypothetical protein
MTKIVRLRSPLYSIFLSNSHVSIRDVTPTSESSADLLAWLDLKLIKNPGDLPPFEKIDQPYQRRLDIYVVRFEHEVRDWIYDDDCGLECPHRVEHRYQMLFQSLQAGTRGMDFQQSFFVHFSRSIPTERMLRRICWADSS